MRYLVAAVAAACLATPATAQPFTDVTPKDTAIVFCPADLGGGGAGLAWVRLGETSGGRDTLDLAAAGLDPATPPAELVPGGGCPTAAVAPSGASLVALNLTGLSEEDGEVIVVDRTAGGAASKPLRLNRRERSRDVTAALASSGAALVAWQESAAGPGDDARDVTTLHVAARDAGGAFVSLGRLGAQSSAVAVGIDEAGLGIVAWSEIVPGAGNRSRLRVATRSPGGPFSAPHEVGTLSDDETLALAVGPSGEALLAVSDDGGVRIGGGSTRSGIGALRRLYAGTADGVTAALSPNGAAAVAWLQPPDRHAPRPGVAVSDRPAGGDFGAPHPLAAAGTRLSGNAVRDLRLAAAPDGRVVASWTVDVSAGDRLAAPVPAAALRRSDGRWEAAVALAAPCREQIGAFPGFDAAGRPRVTFVDAGVVSGGDYGFPYDTRIRVARLDGVPATPTAPPQVTLGAARRQVLRHDRLKLRIRCARDCDAMSFGVIRGVGGLSNGLFPGYDRLRAGRWRTVVLEYASYFDNLQALQREGSTIKVRLVVHACDSAGRMARARRTIGVRIPRTRG